MHGAERGEQREADRGARAVEQPRQHVAAEIIGAEQEHRRVVLSRSIHGSFTVRDRSGSKRCSRRSASTSGCTTGDRPSRCGRIGGACRKSRNASPALVRREPRRDEREQRQRGEKQSGASNHARSPERDARIGVGQQQVGDQRAGGEEERAGRRAAGDEKQIARLERVEHQAAQAGPRRDHFDDERAAEQAADHHAVKPEHRPQRHRPGVTEDRSRAIDAARAAGGDETLVRRGFNRLRLQALERRGHRHAPAPAPAAARGARDRRATRAHVRSDAGRRGHAADRKPSGPRGEKHERQRSDQRRHRQAERREIARTIDRSRRRCACPNRCRAECRSASRVSKRDVASTAVFSARSPTMALTGRE